MTSKNSLKGGSHKVEFVQITQEMRDAKVTGFRLKDIAMLFPWAKDPTIQCDCGVEVPVPYGSLSNYAQHLAKEWGSSDIFATWRVWHFFESPQPPEVVKELEESGKTNRHNSVHYRDNLPEKLGYSVKKDNP